MTDRNPPKPDRHPDPRREPDLPPDFEDDLRALRAQPREEFARELDHRAAARIEQGPARFRGPGWTGAALGAVAAAALAIVIVAGSGGGGSDGGEGSLEVAAVPDLAAVQVPSEVRKRAAEAGDQDRPRAGSAPRAESGPEAKAAPLAKPTPGAPLSLRTPSVESGQPVIVRYSTLDGALARVSLAGQSANLEVKPGSGSLQIATRDVSAGSQQLRVQLGRAVLHAAIQIR